MTGPQPPAYGDEVQRLPSAGDTSPPVAPLAASGVSDLAALDALETRDWVDSLHDVLRRRGPERARDLLESLQIEAQRARVPLPVTARTPYVNTISADRQPAFPGDRVLERRIKSIIRWNAMAMVVEANEKSSGIGGHISTFASLATLLDVGFNHFFRGPDHPGGGDLIYFQGHAAPGVYARAYVERRFTAAQVHNFRREFAPEGGLSSYPHPWLMPDFWQFPTVSMGLGPLSAIYQARYMRYLEDRGLKPEGGQKVWCFIGDGETDEPEALGAISLAAREHLDNLVFVVNCNLQRLDGPVRGNGNIVQELEAVFRGVGWNVLKVIWGSEWDALLARDTEGLLARRMGEIVDGEYQKYTVAGGAYIRERFWGTDPRLLQMVGHLSDDDLWKMRVGGHDPEKVYAAYKVATESTGAPTVILARTVKGYGLGEAGEGKNVSHQQKLLNLEELLRFRDRFEIPLSDEEVVGAPLYRPAEDSAEMEYLRARRAALGGAIPRRRTVPSPLEVPPEELFAEFIAGSGEREASTTMAFVRMLAAMLRQPGLGPNIVPIVPDEARTFGMEALFRQFGIYAHMGQLYEPVDADQLLYYRESMDGQILEEGITEAGSFASFMAAGTAYANYGIHTLPFFIYYSMFGLQRIGDFAWAAGDARCRGFLIGATSGRTTLAGEGLQHQDGHSHVLASVIPNLVSYDPAYAYEIAVIIRDGIRRMHTENEDVFYYLTVGNETYSQPAIPEESGVREGIVRGIYRLRASGLGGAPERAPAPRARRSRARATASSTDARPRAQLLGSGAILNEVVRAAELLEEKYGVSADVYSVTSYTELRRDALDVERWNRLHPMEEPRVPFVTQQLGTSASVTVAASDYLKALPDSIARWVSAPLTSLGTDGFGRSATRAELRDFFEVDARHIALATLHALAAREAIPASTVARALEELGINPEKPNPART